MPKKIISVNKVGDVEQINMDNRREESKKKDIKKNFYWSVRIVKFLQEISVIGIKYTLMQTASLTRRCFWITLILFGVGFMIYQLQERISYYIKYDTTTRIRYRHDKFLRFPTVTICNENRMMKSLVAAEGQGIADSLYTLWPPHPDLKINTTVSDTNGTLSNNTIFDWGEKYREAAQPGKDAIVSCYFNLKKCSASDFITVATNMGYCFQFNSRSKNFIVRAAGDRNALTLTLNVMQEEYTLANAPSAGFRVLLHDPEDTPEMLENGIKLSPGNDFVIRIQREATTLLSKPYGDCNEDNSYRQSACMNKCLSKYVVKQCGCKGEEMLVDDSVPVCSPLNLPCNKVQSDLYYAKEIFKSCQCPTQCQFIKYDASTSYSIFSDFFKRLITNATHYTKTTLEGNFIQLNIYFSTMITRELKEKIAYSWLALMSDVGGAFGLILGSTFLTLFEFLDFLVVSISESLGTPTSKST
ncbi:DgyrCDS8090 [Dimorphilus gyrociliatus]|uniref:DgyrCDS8090 n=1 Tax=Dimorphilus gyrociliatus TaxID=2664684 RepID=A0A7I8VTB2_9ANNE|nr:DgyrCDS8090 [Dimorphilus gyrociliatus]